MILCMTIKDIIDIALQSLVLLVSFGTLILAWIILRHFQRQQLSLKQLDKVTELIDYINNHKIDFLFGGSSGNMFGGNLIQMSLFEIKNMDFDDNNYLYSPIYFDRETKGIIDISNYVNNPLIPKDISEELKNFQSWMGKAIYLSDIEKDCLESDEIFAVIISTKIDGNFTLFNKSDKDENVYIAYGAFACIDWNNFKECSSNLKKSITNWLAKYNIDEIKINE